LLTDRAINGEGAAVTSAPLELMVLASLRSARVQPDGTFQFQLAGEPGRVYVIEVSEDLSRWTPWRTDMVDVEGWLDIRDVASAGPTERFYRARLVPYTFRLLILSAEH
jgi:hypothetical protein